MIQIKVNRPIDGFAVGQVVRVSTDEAGTPLAQQWRRRLKDAEIDGCCEVVIEKSKPRKPNSRSED